MKLKITISSIMALVFIFIFIFTLNSCIMLTPAETTPEETTVKEQESKETETTSKESAANQIKVSKPQPNQVVESPLIIEGEARGTWFFEASFPVKLLDANRDVIATHFAQAQDDWMTEDFVPFKAQIEFEKPATDTGILILEKDNPSGLPENDAKIEIPVRFDNQSAKIVEDTDPQKGEYFVYAILKSIDVKNNMIIVEQLINEPNEKEISPEVKLSEGCKIVKVILERPEEKETVSEITLDSIKPGSEIGIIFKSDNTARAIIYQEIIEK
ncbi:MAG: Gmad2 immunoglobulin-like domain-containing protein [Actinobacteria bacterium]|nr:Gmad2 immunoglobulin-like domain-containing protein [Actinomycetota bacterium]